METLKRNGVAVIFIGVFGLAALLFSVMNVLPAFGGLITKSEQAPASLYRNYEFFASSTAPSTIATTTTATSTNIVAYFDSNGVRDDGSMDIRGAKDVKFYFSRGDLTGQGNTGSTVYKVQVTPDGTNWYDYNRLQQATTTTSANDKAVLVGSASIGAATSTVIYSMETLGFKAVRCIVVETTDGEHGCAASATF